MGREVVKGGWGLMRLVWRKSGGSCEYEVW